MGAHEVGTLAALKAVPIRGAAPPRGQASSTARLATAQLCLPFTEVFRKGCLVKAGHSGKVVCPVEAKWIFCKTTSFYPVFRAQSRMLIEALETLQKAARNELEPNDSPRGRKVRHKSKP